MRWRKQMPDKLLAAVLGRLAIALKAGIDLRRAWASETSRVSRAWRPAMETVLRSLSQGNQLALAMKQAGQTFPPLVLAMVAVGDRTGHEAQTLEELSQVLERSVRNTRAFISSLVWPMFQLIVAIGVVGAMILLSGFVRDLNNKPVDVLGLGLSGVSGLVTYLILLLGCLVVGVLSFQYALASWRGHGGVRLLVDRIPVIGPASRAFEAAVWCRAASLASGAGLDAGQLISLASAAAPGLWLDADRVEERLREGATLEESLQSARRFPRRVLEVVNVGEMTGNTSEVLDRLAGQLDEEARLSFEAAARGAGFLVWTVVACFIVVIIFRIFLFYVGMIQDATSGT